MQPDDSNKVQGKYERYDDRATRQPCARQPLQMNESLDEIWYVQVVDGSFGSIEMVRQLGADTESTRKTVQENHPVKKRKVKCGDRYRG